MQKGKLTRKTFFPRPLGNELSSDDQGISAVSVSTQDPRLDTHAETQTQTLYFTLLQPPSPEQVRTKPR